MCIISVSVFFLNIDVKERVKNRERIHDYRLFPTPLKTQYSNLAPYTSRKKKIPKISIKLPEEQYKEDRLHLSF